MTAREPIFNVPGVVVAMLGLVLAVHVGRSFLGEAADERVLLTMAFIPARFSGEAAQWPGAPWAAYTSLLTHMLVHANWTHLFVNGAWFLAFGGAVARRLGTVRLVGFTIFTGLVAIACYWALHIGGRSPVVGASGAVSGLMAGAFRFFFVAMRLGGARQLAEDIGSVPRVSVVDTLKDRQVMTITGVFIALNLVAALLGEALTEGGAIAWEAHIGGFLAGLLGFGLFDRQTGPALEGR
ncbi:MAG: rhomboid family intramembrane serine protease [Hyphomicrobiaceae bacterium]